MAEATTAPTDNEAVAEKDVAALEQPRRNRRVSLIALAVVAVLLLAGGLWYARYETSGKYFQTTNDAYVQSDAIVVSSKVAGYVDQVYVADNQAVRAGQSLLRVDAREYQAQAEQAQAQIDVANANAQGVRAQINEQGAGVLQARAQLAVAQNNLAFARSEVARYSPLAATGAETREHLTQLRSQEQQAAAQVANAQAALLSAERRTGTLRSQVQQALSQGRAAEAQLRAANVNVGSTIIRASTDGRVASKSVQVGQLVQPGLRLMSIVPVQKLYVSANFKETQLTLMRIGQPVTIKVDALGGVEFHGKLESLSPGTGAQFSLLPPQNATGNFTKIVQRVPVRISIDAGPLARSLLVPGMSAEVTVDTRSARNQAQQLQQEESARSGGK